MRAIVNFAAVGLGGFLFNGCGSPGPASIQFTQVPEAGPGGAAKIGENRRTRDRRLSRVKKSCSLRAPEPGGYSLLRASHLPRFSRTIRGRT